MIAELVNMVPVELIGFLGDTHVYMNQMDGVKEQLSRNGSDIYPQLKITGMHKKIEDFKFDDFEITDYHPDQTIKFPLSVG
jgi:thymidylate synthase